MHCKNCGSNLRTDYSYCPNCGAKVIRNRITIKNLWFDVVERFFNIDNTFIKTYLHLFTKPEKVIGGYISGQRKKYLNPISYFTIALTLSGILVFIIQRFYPDSIDMQGSNPNISQEFADKWANITLDFNALFFIMYIPILALPAWLILNKVKYNVSEYVVVFIYVLAQYSITSFPISLSTLAISPDSYLGTGQVILFFLLIYCLFTAWRLNRFSLKEFTWRTLTFSILVVFLFIGVIIAVFIALIATGVFSFEEFKPQK